MKDQPLRVSIEDNELVVRIGIDVIAFAANESDTFKPYDDKVGDWVHKFKVVDALAFAGDVKRAMLDEAEDGSNPLSRFLDKMNEAALDDGADGVEYPNNL